MKGCLARLIFCLAFQAGSFKGGNGQDIEEDDKSSSSDDFTQFIPAEPEQLGVCDSTSCSFTKDKRDWTSRVGLGESPGVPNLEFLGTGYDILYGNPRGSDSGERDPGFRSRVVSLIKDLGITTYDEEYAIPIGVELSYVPTCRFDSKSTEISSFDQYQEQLSKETSSTLSFSLSGGGSKGGKAGKMNSSLKFSKSEKSMRFQESSEQEKSVTFEAMAVCTEFDASLTPFAEKTTSTQFLKAIEFLPAAGTFSKDIPSHVQAYDDFLRAFGTHFVRQVILGGKHIYATSLTARDVMELTKESVEVEDSLSFGAQFALGTPSYVKDALTEDDSSSSLVTVNNNCEAEGPEAPMPPAPAEGGGSFGFSYEKFTKTSKESESLSKISEKDFKTSETTVGGDPPTDGNWKSWAASVRSKPMPISYDLQGIWTLFNDTQLEGDFFDAVEVIYDINLDPDSEANKLLELFHFGVSDPEGDPISAYTLDPTSPFRALLQIDSFPGRQSIDLPDPKMEVVPTAYDGDEGFFDGGEFKGTTQFGFYACGAAVDSEFDGNGLDDEGIVDIAFVYCDSRPDSDTLTPPVRLAPNNDKAGGAEFKGIAVDTERVAVGGSPVKACKQGKYVYQMRMKHDNEKTDEIGMHALQIRCREPGSTEEGDTITVFCNEDGDSDDGADGNCDDDEFEAFSAATDDYFVTAGRVKIDEGVEALELQLREYTDEFPPAAEVITYVIVAEGQSTAITPYFVQMIRGTVSKNGLEDKIKGILDIDGTLSVERAPFGIGAKEMPKFGVTDFKNSIRRRRSTMPNFCYLTAENLPRTDQDSDIIVGVVHPDGYALNDPTDCFEITIDACDDETAAVCYTVEFGSSFGSTPTLLVFPTWFVMSQGIFPENVGDISAAVKECTGDFCTVRLGTVEGVGYRKIGFNFLAIDGDLENPAIAHGRIIGGPQGNNSNSNFGDLGQSWSIDGTQSNCNGCNGMESTLSENSPGGFSDTTTMCGAGNEQTCTIWGFNGGVIIKFNEHFKDIPSVIATPILVDGDVEHMAIDKLKVPLCVVEYITKKECFIKCGQVDTTTSPQTYSPLSFAFVAIGPVSSNAVASTINSEELRNAGKDHEPIIINPPTGLPSKQPSSSPTSEPIETHIDEPMDPTEHPSADSPEVDSVDSSISGAPSTTELPAENESPSKGPAYKPANTPVVPADESNTAKEDTGGD